MIVSAWRYGFGAWWVGNLGYFFKG